MAGTQSSDDHQNRGCTPRPRRCSCRDQLAPHRLRRRTRSEFTRPHPALGGVFLAVNAVVLVAAIVVSYLAHDPEPGFAEAKAKVDAHRFGVQALRGELHKLAEELRSAVELAKERGWQLIGYYRMVNRRYRPSPPAYFDDETDKNHRPAFADVAEIEAESAANDVRGEAA